MSEQATYYQMLEQLLIGRAVGSLGEDDEDKLLEAMDACWWALSAKEQDEIKQHLASLKQLPAPEILDLIDIEVIDSVGRVPRQVA